MIQVIFESFSIAFFKSFLEPFGFKTTSSCISLSHATLVGASMCFGQRKCFSAHFSKFAVVTIFVVNMSAPIVHPPVTSVSHFFLHLHDFPEHPIQNESFFCLLQSHIKYCTSGICSLGVLDFYFFLSYLVFHVSPHLLMCQTLNF